MSDYCHRKVIRMKISEEEACKIFGVDDGWGISDLLEKTEFEIAPTSDFFLDYVLSSRNDAEGDWGRTRRLGNAEYVKYGSKFSKLLKRRIVMPNELRLVEYCWYDCSEAQIILMSQLITMTFMMRCKLWNEFVLTMRLRL